MKITYTSKPNEKKSKPKTILDDNYPTSSYNRNGLCLTGYDNYGQMEVHLNLETLKLIADLYNEGKFNNEPVYIKMSYKEYMEFKRINIMTKNTL